MKKLVFVVMEKRNGKMIAILMTENRGQALRCKNQCGLCVRYISERWEIV